MPARHSVTLRSHPVKITDVEAIVLRQAEVNEGIADGSQDDLVVRIHTDEGITGIGEVDSSPELVAGARPGAELARGRREPARRADRRGPARRRAALAEDVPRPHLLRPARDRDPRDQRPRHRALGHQGQGARASRSTSCSATPHRDRVRAYASMLMPDTPEEVTEAVDRAARAELHGRQARLGAARQGRRARRRARRGRQGGRRRRRRDHDRLRPRLRRRREARRSRSRASTSSSGSTGWRSRSSRTSTRRTRSSPTRSTSASRPASRTPPWWGFRELIDRAHVDLVQPDVTRCGGITETLRIAELAHSRGVATVPHAWKSGIIKAASLHCNAVMPDGIWQEYCVADTPIAKTLTVQRLPIEADGYVAVPDRARPRRRPRRGRRWRASGSAERPPDRTRRRSEG